MTCFNPQLKWTLRPLEYIKVNQFSQSLYWLNLNRQCDLLVLYSRCLSEKKRESKISTMTLRCNIDRIWWDLIHARFERKDEGENNLFDVTLTGEKNCCFRPKSDKPNNISGICRKKKKIHKNVGTKKQQQERHRKKCM